MDRYTDDCGYEEWRAVPGCSFYDVSNLGRVRSWARLGRGTLQSRLPEPRPMRSSLTTSRSTAYYEVRVRLDSNGKMRTKLVHALVALAFLGPRPMGHEVCHGDGNGLNNALTNLRYGTRLDNAADAVAHGSLLRGLSHWCGRLSDEDVRNIRAHRGWLESGSLSMVYGVSTGHIYAIWRGEERAHVL